MTENFPESARTLAIKGAELILVSNSCPIDENRRSQLRSRAFENMTAIAMANYADDNGHSMISTELLTPKTASTEI